MIAAQLGINETERHLLDIASVATMVASLSELLPHVAAGFTIVWTGLRIWGDPTVQGWFGRVPPSENKKE